MGMSEWRDEVMDSILVRGREIAERHNQDGDGFKNVGRKNAYECEACGSYIVTIDRAPGVTPFMVKCENCGGMAKSKLYRVQSYLEPTHEWYRPERLEDVPPGSADHISRGGLILREIDGERGWSIAPVKYATDIEKERGALQEMMKAIEREESVLGKIDFPNVMTRQQIRHAERKDRAAPAEITMYGHRYQRID